MRQKTEVTRKRIDAFPHHKVPDAYRDKYAGCSSNAADSVKEIADAIVEIRRVSAGTIRTYTA